MRKLVVGTRKSQLALTQTQWVIDQLKDKHPQLDIELKKITTKGDRILHVTLSKVGGKGLFVKEIEQALFDRRIDLAIHSMKDLPGELPKGLVIGAIPTRENPFDGLISREGQSLEQLPEGAVVGTSSLRRKAQILAARPDLKVEPVRGNINTRLEKLKNGSFDAIVLAVSGLARMGWKHYLTQEMTLTEMVPAVGQGALAVQCRADDHELIECLQSIHQEETAQLVQAERAFLYSFQGGCHLPIAGYAERVDGKIRLTGFVADPDGRKIIRSSLIGQNAEKLGQTLAAQFIEQGAKELLSTV